MIDEKPENPMAYPGSKWTPDNQDVSEGMSLRDYFAGQALSGLCSGDIVGNMSDVADGARGGMREAKAAYQIADAMLKARSK